MKIYQGFVLAVFVSSAVLLGGCNLFSPEANRHEVVVKTSTGDHYFLVEVADDKEARTLGLMHRENLDKDKGMLFVYNEELIPGFWMKNMLISLDIIFIDGNYQVTDYFENVPPCDEEPCERYKPVSKSKYALELPAGTADKIMLAKGDTVELNE